MQGHAISEEIQFNASGLSRPAAPAQHKRSPSLLCLLLDHGHLPRAAHSAEKCSQSQWPRSRPARLWSVPTELSACKKRTLPGITLSCCFGCSLGWSHTGPACACPFRADTVVVGGVGGVGEGILRLAAVPILQRVGALLPAMQNAGPGRPAQATGRQRGIPPDDPRHFVQDPSNSQTPRESQSAEA